MNETATFIGHRECYGIDKNKLEIEVKKLVEQGVKTFISGGMGDFDWLAASTVYKLKQEYTTIKNFLIIPYLNFNVRNRELFDEIIYPDGFEKYYFKAAIIKRNKYLVDNSAYAVCYITHNWCVCQVKMLAKGPQKC